MLVMANVTPIILP